MKKLNGHIIYAITNRETGQRYVGRTCDFKRRKREHFQNLRNGKHSSPHLQNAYNKAPGCFDMVPICHGLGLDEAVAVEQKLLDELFDELYNYSKSATTGIAAGTKLSEATKRKMSKAQKGKNNPRYGKPVTEETRRKISEAHKGKRLGWRHSEETKRKIAEGQKRAHERRKREVN